MEEGKKLPGSLRNKLITLMVLGYVLPVALILVLLGGFISQQMDAQLQETVELSLRETTELAANYVESIFSDSRRASYDGILQEAWQQFGREENQASLYFFSQSYLNNAYRYNDLFHTAGYFYLQEGLTPQFVYNTTEHRIAHVQDMYQEVLPELLEMSQELGTGLGFYGENGRLFLLRNLVTSDFTPYALLVLEVNGERMLGAFQGISGVHLVEMDFSGMAELRWENEEKSEGLMALSREKMVEQHRLTVTLGVDTDQGREELRQFSRYLLLVLLLVFPAIFFLVNSFYRDVTLPISRLMEGAKAIEAGKLGYQVELEAQSQEFEAITQGFNAMSHSMKTQLEESVQEQIALHDAKIKTLQSQINPHFLNNTLEIINWEVRMAGNENAAKMIESLSVMLSATMDRRGRPKISLADELTYVEAYLYIQSCRMGKRLTVIRRIPEEVLGYLVPKLALQPLVENAFDHGISALKQGEVEISALVSEGDLILEVKNSGKLTESDLLQIDNLLEWDEKDQSYTMDSASLGIRNVNQRVKMMYGQDYGLDIFNNSQGKTVVRLAVPLEEA